MQRVKKQTRFTGETILYFFSNKNIPPFKYHFAIKLIILFLTSSIFLPAAMAQDPKEEPTIIDDKPINIDTVLFTIPFTVSDSKGRNVPGLQKKNFTIYQDGEEQDIEIFLNEEAPMNVAILLDTSYSTKEVLDDIQKAARNFVKILRPEDKAVIVGFDNRTLFLSDLTSDRKVLSKAIGRVEVSKVTGSDMYEAITLVLKKHFASLKGRKAIIALTDGIVAGRNNTVQQILDSMQETDTVFYPVIFKTKFYSKNGAQPARPKLIRILEILADETAGRLYEKEATKLKEAFESIAGELKKQYLIGFYPDSNDEGKTTGYVRVDVDQKSLIIKSKKKLKL